jgi:hypothetical protein
MVTSELRYEVHTSRYSNDRSTRSSSFRPAEFFNCSVDEQTKDVATRRLEEIRRRQRDCQERMRNALAQLQPLEERVQTMNTEKSGLDKTKSALEKQLRDYSVAQRRLENCKQQLKDMVESLAQLTEDPIKAEIVNLFKEHKQTALSAAAALQDYNDLFVPVIVGQLIDSLNTSELGRVRAQIEEQESRQEHLKIACQEAERVFVNAKNEAKALLEKANRAPISDELKVLLVSSYLFNFFVSESLPSFQRPWPSWMLKSHRSRPELSYCRVLRVPVSLLAVNLSASRLRSLKSSALWPRSADPSLAARRKWPWFMKSGIEPYLSWSAALMTTSIASSVSLTALVKCN